MVIRVPALTVGIALAFATASAQDGTLQGIAYVEAPEMSSGVCVGEDAQEAFACAKQQCITGGGTDEDCLEIAYCYPARTSIDIFMQHQEGIHWHEFMCGLDSKETALALAKAACDKTLRPYLIECTPVMFYDANGNAEEIPFEN